MPTCTGTTSFRRNWQANEGLIPMEEGRRLAREAVERALLLNPSLAEAHAQMGRIKQQVDYDWAGANASFQRAVALEPGNPEHVYLAALPAVCFGHFDEALQLDHQAIDLDPLNADSWEFLAETQLYMGQLARIIHIFEDNKSLLCYKHVVETVFGQQKRLLNV
jgi:tetratricopeptide (TPR) repeat protein